MKIFSPDKTQKRIERALNRAIKSLHNKPATPAIIDEAKQRSKRILNHAEKLGWILVSDPYKFISVERDFVEFSIPLPDQDTSS